MSGLKERLERLRAAAKAAESAGGADPAEREEHGGSDAVPPAPPGNTGLHEAFRKLGVEEMTNDAGTFLLRRIVYPFPYRHGRYGLEELIACAPRLHPVACRQNGKTRSTSRGSRDSETADAPIPTFRGLLFLDTETTGLGVGAGNVPFMIGIGSCTEAAFVVEQGLIRDPGEERAMLTWLTGKFDGVTHLATYNGRSFDWPVLVGRFILNGWRRSGPEPGHLDFLHPSRALWKNTLPSCRLGIVEEERLGIARGPDVSGALAPELYMRYLRDGNPEHLEGVYVHNEKDVLTLAALAIHFGHLLGGGLGSAAPDPADAEERFRTGAWLERHGQPEEARRLYDSLAEEAPAASGSETGFRLALAAKYKRLGKWERAVPLWKRAAELAEKARLPRTDAHLELAIYYEHRAKDYGAALGYAEAALELVRRRLSLLRTPSQFRELKASLEKRIERLNRKLYRESFDLNAGRGRPDLTEQQAGGLPHEYA
ncbi:hypothetical protein GE107_19135 [Cohnella sp. CFH 77786]|uniref:ribonuclease H-like domain-containing protein n=1 Tax=Cohnella sp. CFH 77786 TaxID=2662265 RepID=UPI001C608BD6|nr:ribonuclease H-like domain-containing protein [Cohnella sp. CFH 77786]MBW5448177.1 hypothetical protein [Cohnella sp. CFH 77786]